MYKLIDELIINSDQEGHEKQNPSFGINLLPYAFIYQTKQKGYQECVSMYILNWNKNSKILMICLKSQIFNGMNAELPEPVVIYSSEAKQYFLC